MEEFLEINTELAEKYGIESWTNPETFDRTSLRASSRYYRLKQRDFRTREANR